jgi:N-acetylglutamate synthase-like GNAT family acetyltransferase
MITLISSSTNTKIIEKIVEIHTKCIKETNSQYYNNKQIDEWISLINRENVKNQLKNTTWILLRENNEIIGFAQYSKKDKSIYQIQITPSKQRKGYGRQIYEYIENDFRRNNINEIQLMSTLNALPFYNSLGFNITKKKNFKLKSVKIKMSEMKKVLLT